MTRSIQFLLILSAAFIISCTPKVRPAHQTEIIISEDQKLDLKIPEKLTDLDPVRAREDAMLAVKIPLDPAFRTGVLENGLHYFIRRNTKPENRAELRLAIRAGSVDEEDDEKGLAHFIEHMQFNGTKNFSRNDLIHYFEKIGTRFGPDLNAYTSFDRTVYRLQVRTDIKNHLDTGLLVLHDWAGRALLEQEEIDKERGIIMAEWRSRLSSQQRIIEQTFPVIYEGSRYPERFPIGDPDVIQNADHGAFKKFYNHWYRPDLMAIIIVGDINVDRMEARLTEMFSPLKNPVDSPVRPEYKVPYHEGTKIITVSDGEASSASVEIISKMPKKKLKNKYDLMESIHRDLFIRMLNARLQEHLNSQDPPFIYAGAGYYSDYGDIDSYRISASVSEEKAAVALEVLTIENERVLRYGFYKSEFDRQFTNLINSAERQAKEADKTESSIFANRTVSHYLDNTPLMAADQYYNFIRFNRSKINLNKVNSLAAEFIKEDNRVIVITGPEKKGFSLPDEEEIRKIFSDINNAEIELYEDIIAERPLFAKELRKTDISQIESYDKYGIKRIRLENGIEVYYKITDFKNDEILFTSFSKGGTSLYDDREYVNAVFAANAVSQMGLSGFTNTQLEKALTGKSVFVNAGINSLYQYLNGRSSVRDMETMFQLINLRFTEPGTDKNSFDSYISRSKSQVTNLMKNPDHYFNDAVRRIKYNDHLRSGTIPKAEDYDLVAMNEALRIYKDRFADAGSFRFFFVGSIDEKKLLDYCSRYLGTIPTRRPYSMWIDRNVDMIRGTVNEEFYRGEAPKSYVDISYSGDLSWTVQTSHIIRSLIEVLRIKLRESLREDIGGVYGVMVYGGAFNEPKQGYSVSISFNCEPEEAEELIAEAMQVIKSIQSDGPDEQVMQKIKEAQRQTRIRSIRENNYWLSMMEMIVSDGLDFSELSLETLEERLNSLSEEDIRDAAKRYIDDKNRIQIVMHPENHKGAK